STLFPYTTLFRSEALDRNARLEAGKRRTDAEVKTATEREVGSGVGVVNVVMGAPGLLGRWPIGSGPKQEEAAVCGDRHVLEARVGRSPSVVELERPVVTEDVLERLGNPFGVTAETFLEIGFWVPTFLSVWRATVFVALAMRLLVVSVPAVKNCSSRGTASYSARTCDSMASTRATRNT